MVSLEQSDERRVELMYNAAREDVAFSQIARVLRVDLSDDGKAAELIEIDGRVRIAIGRFVDLGRYLETVPGLRGREVPLDAAIDVTLRSLSGSTKPTREAVDTLLANYPDLAAPIQEAASLAEAICSTSTLRNSLTEPPRALPSDFGPALSSGLTRFELRRLLGAGSWGQVYLAHDRLLSDANHEALVAVKLPVFGVMSTAARQRFIEEAAKARRVVHPNVVRVLDRGVGSAGEDYIVYELVEGGSLSERVDAKGGRLEAREAATLVAQMARGIHAAHLAGLVHCDLKPSNILLTQTGQPKVADFGIAVRQDLFEATDLAAAGDRAGNIAFTSPEQFRMEDGALAIPADIYALGGILYFLLTGELPNGDTAEEIALAHDRTAGRAEPPSVRATRPELDADLERVCRRAMAVNAADRHASAASLADDLEAWLAREPIPWTRPSAFRKTRLWCSRKPGVAAAIAVGTVAALAGAVFGTYQAINAARAWHETEIGRAKIEGARLLATNELNKLTWLRSSGFDNQMPILLMGWDSVGGSAYMVSSEDRKRLWRERQTIAKRRVDQRAAGGQADSLDALMWQSGLGLWLLCDGKPNKALAVLDDNLARWRGRLKDNDPWIGQLELLISAGRAEAVMATGSPLSDEQKAELERHAAELEREKTTFGVLDEKSVIRRTVLRTMIRLYGPDQLNRPAEHRRVAAALKAAE